MEYSNTVQRHVLTSSQQKKAIKATCQILGSLSITLQRTLISSVRFSKNKNIS